MLEIRVRLFVRLVLEGYGRGRQAAGDGTFPLTLRDGSKVRDAIEGMRVPAARVGMTLVNARICPLDTPLAPGDRVVLVPQDLAALWPARLRQRFATVAWDPWASVPGRDREQKRLAVT